MIVGNTLIRAIRERSDEIAMLKTLGFIAGRIVRIILSEPLLTALVGSRLISRFGRDRCRHGKAPVEPLGRISGEQPGGGP